MVTIRQFKEVGNVTDAKFEHYKLYFGQWNAKFLKIRDGDRVKAIAGIDDTDEPVIIIKKAPVGFDAPVVP